jgi:hypothetical protein
METLTVDSELISICDNIKRMIDEGRDWNATESSDEFQSKNYCGGWESIEGEFTFSYYNQGHEYWFQLSLQDIEDILIGRKKFIQLNKPNK